MNCHAVDSGNKKQDAQIYTVNKAVENCRKYSKWNHGGTSFSSVILIDQKPDNVSCDVKIANLSWRGYDAIASMISLSQIGFQANFARLWAPL